MPKACPYKVIGGGLEGDEFVGEEVAGGFFADDGVPEHRGDAVAGTLDGEVFFGEDVALADGACCDDAFACHLYVGTLGLCHDLLAGTEGFLDVAYGGHHGFQFRRLQRCTVVRPGKRLVKGEVLLYDFGSHGRSRYRDFDAACVVAVAHRAASYLFERVHGT